MDSRIIDQAKRACLKQSFGGTLDASERELLDQFLATEEGRRYLEESRDVQRLLGDVAEVNLNQAVDSQRMVAQFESMARRDMRRAQRWLPVAFLLGPGALAAIGAYCLQRGGERTFLGWTLCAWAAFFAVLLVAFWWQQEAMIGKRALLASLEEDRRLSRSRPVLVRGVLVLAALYLSIGFGVYRVGGLAVLALAAVVTVGFSLWLEHQTRSTLRKHEEFWEWWEGSER